MAENSRQWRWLRRHGWTFESTTSCGNATTNYWRSPEGEGYTQTLALKEQRNKNKRMPPKEKPVVTDKICKRCGTEKPISEYYKHRTTHDKLRPICKRCCREENLKWQAENRERWLEVHRNDESRRRRADPEKSRAKARTYYAKTADRRRELCRKWHAENRETVRAGYKKRWARNRDKWIQYAREYYKANAWKWLETNKRWREKNPEKAQAAAQNVRAKRQAAPGRHTGKDIANLYILQRGKCLGCGCKLSKSGKGKYHIDHVVPLSKGGSNNVDNLQLLCPRCNISKFNKSPEEWAASRGRLFA